MSKSKHSPNPNATFSFPLSHQTRDPVIVVLSFSQETCVLMRSYWTSYSKKKKTRPSICSNTWLIAKSLLFALGDKVHLGPRLSHKLSQSGSPNLGLPSLCCLFPCWRHGVASTEQREIKLATAARLWQGCRCAGLATLLQGFCKIWGRWCCFHVTSFVRWVDTE